MSMWDDCTDGKIALTEFEEYLESSPNCNTESLIIKVQLSGKKLLLCFVFRQQEPAIFGKIC